MDIIKALKENTKPFCFMTKEMQKKAKEIQKTKRRNYEFEYHSYHVGWHCASTPDWDSTPGMVFRLRPDYEETPSAVKCDVVTNYTGVFYRRNNGVRA